MAYNPNLPPGQATSAESAPVVVASDNTVPVDLTEDWLLVDLRRALMAIAGAKGLLSDLRVTPTGTVTTSVTGTAAVTQSGSWNLGTLSQMGTLNWNLNNAVPNWSNSTYTQSFTANISRT